MQRYTLDDAARDYAAACARTDQGTMRRLERLVDELDQAPPAPPPSLHAAALWYAEHGYHVFPLAPGSKIPRKGSAGFKDATCDRDQVHAWWSAEPDANIGLATGHLVDAVDFDGLLGQTSRAHNWDMFAQLEHRGTVLTPRAGGMHIYVPASGYGNKAGILPGVDYRGLGGYVVAPPSRTDQGSYRFLRPLQVTSAAGAAA